MKLNPYSVIMIAFFVTVVSVSNYSIKKTKEKYEKNYNDSCLPFDDSVRIIGKM